MVGQKNSPFTWRLIIEPSNSSIPRTLSRALFHSPFSRELFQRCNMVRLFPEIHNNRLNIYFFPVRKKHVRQFSPMFVRRLNINPWSAWNVWWSTACHAHIDAYKHMHGSCICSRIHDIFLLFLPSHTHRVWLRYICIYPGNYLQSNYLHRWTHLCLCQRRN